MTNLTPTPNPVPPTSPFEGIHEGNLIEWTEDGTIASGGTPNGLTVRKVGLVSVVKDRYLIVLPADGFDAYSRVRIYPSTPVTVIAEQAEAGWAKLA